ncbi:hypothetical protein ACS5PJ_07610 [Pseudarthrobacter sp. YS3]|uniref:hypothetical protein n=1 Tax=Pseudarthrobacter sp. YS3 TaxID=3453718 RepID=UPI003EEEC6F7
MAVRPARGLRLVLPWLILGVSAALWGIGLAMTPQVELDDFGLLTVLPPVWFVGVALVVGLCIWGTVAHRMFSPRLISASLTGLVLMLYATPALLASVPRFPWTYKHIAVTNFISGTGQVDPSIDIYNRWPGFFSLSAFLGDVMGYRNALDYAAWAETGFALVDAVLVLAIARSITGRARIYWTATLVFTLSNWVNQNYYSPQSFSYTMYLAMCLIALTFLRNDPIRALAGFEGRLERFSIIQRFKKRQPTPVAEKWGQPVMAAQAGAIVAILLLQTVIVVSHQLTPYMAILGLFPLFFAGYFRARWLGLGLVAIALAYLVPNLAYIKGKYGLFTGFDIFANTGYKPPEPGAVVLGTWVLTGQTLAHLAAVLTLLTGLLALAGFVRRIIKGDVRTTLVVAWLAFAPILSLLAQSYGGEGRFRVFLFSLPWLSIGVAWFFWSGPVRSSKAVAGATAALAAMALLFTVVHFQPEADNRISKDVVAASQWLDMNTKAGDLVFDTKYFFPHLIGPNYPHFLQWGAVSSLVEYFKKADGDISVEGLRDYADRLRGAENNYVIISEDQKRDAVERQRFEADYLPRLEGLLENGVAAENVYSNDTVSIFRIKSAR